MKIKIFTSMILLVFLSTFSITVFAKSSNVTINVYNWGEYISDGTDGSIDVNDEFTKKTGINVHYTTFQSNEEMFAKLVSGGADYDVIVPSDYMVSKLIENNMLAKLNFNNIPNFSLIDEKMLNPEYDITNEYSVPYAWGMVGIFYNKNKVSETEDEIGWDILWNAKYKGQILMFDNSRDAFSISLMRLGRSVNSINEQDWYDAAEELSKQKPLVQSYVMDQIFDKMSNGEAALAPYYAGDAVVLIKDNPNIGFTIPKEGTTKFVDAMCIPANSMHKEEAEAYINFMCETYIAKANIDRIGYSTPQKEVFKQLDPQIANNEMFYPSDDVLNKTEVFKNLPDNISTLLDSLWVEVKTGQKGSTCALVAVFLGFVLLYIFIVTYKKMRIKKGK